MLKEHNLRNWQLQKNTADLTSLVSFWNSITLRQLQYETNIKLTGSKLLFNGYVIHVIQD
jgi:hypothetical protein